MASLLRAAPLCGDPAPRAPSFPRGAASCRLRARSPNFPVRLSAPRSRLQFPPGEPVWVTGESGAEPTPCAPLPHPKGKSEMPGKSLEQVWPFTYTEGSRQNQSVASDQLRHPTHLLGEAPPGARGHF